MKALVSIALSACVAAGAAQASTLDSIYSSYFALGDSLSDPGNLGENGPGFPYVGNRFSNGPVFTEYLADGFTEGVNTQNYAYGGARTTDTSPSPDLPEQQQLFLGDLTGADINPATGQEVFEGTPQVGDNPLVSVWFGANDIFGALETLGGDLQSIDPDASQFEQDIATFEALVRATDTALDAAGNVADLVSSLSAAPFGLDNFVVLNLPDLGQVPAFNQTPLSEAATGLSIAFNAALAFELSQVEANVTEIDTFSLFNQLLAGEILPGLTNVSDACVIPGEGFCGFEEGATYAFWDGVHPTTLVHERLAQDVAAAVVPIPASFTLLLAALGGIALVRRRIS